MDQGGELFRNPKVRKIFEKRGFKIHPTGTDASHQNGPVERAHRTVAKGIQALLIGSNLDPKFWPYEFRHYIRLRNSYPSRNQVDSPIYLAFKLREIFQHLTTFGCRVWARPTQPHGRRARGKLHADSRKGLFLGYCADTTRNIYYFDVDTHRIKIASNFRFDEGFNNLPQSEHPPNAIGLANSQNGIPIPIQDHYTSSDDLTFFTSPFPNTFTKTIIVSSQQPTSEENCFGFVLRSNDLNGRVFVDKILPRSDANAICTTKTVQRNIKGSFIVAVN